MRRLPAVLAAAALALAGCSVEVVPLDPAALADLDRTGAVVAADGTVLADLHGTEDRVPLPLAAVPPLVVQAVLAAEDQRFYDHDGVDPRGLARAAVADLRAGAAEQGGSTITQQLVKKAVVGDDRSLARKVREAGLALGLEESLTKDEILERYLDTVYLGGGAYGVGAALVTWFGVTASPGGPPPAVTPGQAALLAGLIRSPTSADPVQHPDAAAARRASVLAQMVGTGAISAEQQAAAEAEPLPIRTYGDAGRWRSPYAVSLALSTLLDDPRLGATRDERRALLLSGGVRVETTIDPRHQAAAEESVSEVLDAPGDPDAAVVSVRPGTGEVTALVGGRDYYDGSPVAKVNLATGGSTGRQAGSTFKVFALLAALEDGLGPTSPLDGPSEVVVPRRAGPAWTVTNYGGTAFAEGLTLQGATEASVNTAYAELVVRLGDGDADAGAARVVDVAERLGVAAVDGGPLRREPAVVLGAQEVSPLDLAGAYAALAAGGEWVEPHVVSRVVAPDGTVLLEAAPARSDAVPEGVAAVATDVLRGVIDRGTGVRARLARPAAGKTGTTQEHRDAWFVGYTPTLATAVWLGRAATPVPMLPENGFRTVVAGGTFPAEIWRRTVERSLAGEPSPDFPSPDAAVVDVRLDVLHGCLATELTPAPWVRETTVLRGTEPSACTQPSAPTPARLPDALGAAATEVADGLASVGLEVVRTDVPAGGFRPGTVVGQEPPAGSPVAPGTRVELQVAATGRVAVTVPDLLGQGADLAAAAVRGAGLRPVLVEAPACDSGTACSATRAATAGSVWRQEPAAGAPATSGDPVSITVGPGGR